MRWPARVGVATIAAAAVATGVRGDTCKDEDREANGKCPAKPIPPPAPPARPPAIKSNAPTPPPAQPAVSGCPGGMVHVPAGTFFMGNPDGTGANDEHPQHKVTLSGFCIDKTEVTVAAYAACAAKGGCAPAPTTNHVPGQDDANFAKLDQFCNGSRSDRQSHPINCVDWSQAKTYCEWAGKRLPTEAAWEYAARGTDGRTYPWGNDAPSAKRLNACGTECTAMLKREGLGDFKPMYDGNDGFESTAPVGSFPDGASPFGALDSADAATNPTGAADDAHRVIRGGGWLSVVAGGVRAAYRNRNDPGLRSSNLGFRCARGD